MLGRKIKLKKNKKKFLIKIKYQISLKRLEDKELILSAKLLKALQEDYIFKNWENMI